jgi:hypothetical protein
MQLRSLRFPIVLLIATSCLVPPAPSQNTKSGGDFATGNEPFHPEARIPDGAILVKGAWASASDSTTPVPEGGSVAGEIFRDGYFGLNYPLPKNWTEKYKGPPPSDSGRYVLLQLQPLDSLKGKVRGSVLITAQDMFFTSLPAKNALQLVNYEKSHLQADYQLELPPTETKISGHPFLFYAYWSPVAELHWYVLATEIRCHEVEMVFTSQDTKLLEGLVREADQLELPAHANPTTGMGGGTVPMCIKDYATEEHVITRVEPVFAERTFNPVPVRIIIDKNGKVKHIHFLSAFPSQAKAITDALNRWRFKPYLVNKLPVEVETGIMFGRAPHVASSAVE